MKKILILFLVISFNVSLNAKMCSQIKANNIDISQDGKSILQSGEHDIVVWDIATQTQKYTHQHKGRSGLYSSAISPDGDKVAAGGYPGGFDGNGNMAARLHVWDSEKKVFASRGHKGKIQSVVFSKDGNKIITGSSDQTVKIWNAQTGRHIRTLNGDTKSVQVVAINDNGRRIVSGSSSGIVKVWDTAKGTLERTFEFNVKQPILSIAISPEGNEVAARGNSYIQSWRLSDGKELFGKKLQYDNSTAINYSPKGDKLLLLSSGSIDMIDVTTGNPIEAFRRSQKIMEVHEAYKDAVISPDGKKVYATTSSCVFSWDIEE